MSTAALVSLQEYLATTYHPDCDYVDGVLVERSVGQKDHSKLQGEAFAWFRSRRQALGLAPFVEQRIQVKPRRYRVPDVCIVQLPEPAEQIFTRAPYICVEILSPEDTFPKLQERLDDYLHLKVPNIWVLDPVSRRGWRITREGHFEALDRVLRTSDGAVQVLPIAELFTLGG